MPPTLADNRIRDELHQIRDQLADLRQRKAAAKKEEDAAKEAFAGVKFEPGTKITDTPEFHAAEQAVKRHGDLKDEIENHRLDEQKLLGLLSDQNGHDTDTSSHPSLERNRRGPWNAHQLFAQSEEYQQAIKLGSFRSKQKFGAIQIGEIASREDTAAFFRSARMESTPGPSAPGGAGWGTSYPDADPGPVSTFQPAVPSDYRGLQPPLRLPTLLDIFPTGTTNSNSIDYVQIIAIPAGAGPVEEGEIKPESGIEFNDETANVITIAGWIKLNRIAMDDMPFVAGMVNTLLPWDVRRKVVWQVLLGDAEGQNLRGLYNTTGVGQADAVASDNIADAFLRAMTLVILSDAEPNFGALNPLTWQDLLLMKNAQGNYIYGAPGNLPGGMVAQTVWGLTLTAHRSIPQDKPLVGDSMGATILVREGVNVRTSDSDQDDFVRNRVTVLAETRIAFVVWRPSSFAFVNLGEEEE